jgi:hypothetical protein
LSDHSSTELPTEKARNTKTIAAARVARFGMCKSLGWANAPLVPLKPWRGYRTPVVMGAKPQQTLDWQDEA